MNLTDYRVLSRRIVLALSLSIVMLSIVLAVATTASAFASNDRGMCMGCVEDPNPGGGLISLSVQCAGPGLECCYKEHHPDADDEDQTIYVDPFCGTAQGGCGGSPRVPHEREEQDEECAHAVGF